MFNDDIAAIQHVLQGNAQTSVGIEKLQRCLDVMTERLDFNIQNNIPVPTPLSEILSNTIKRSREFITNDYDKAVFGKYNAETYFSFSSSIMNLISCCFAALFYVIDKIIMVLVNSETISKRGVVVSSDDGADDADGDHVMQREEVSEEEVLQEQEEEE